VYNLCKRAFLHFVKHAVLLFDADKKSPFMKANGNNTVTALKIIKSVIFNTYFYVSVTFCLIFIFSPLTLFKSERPMRNAILGWINSVFFMLEHIVNITIEERGTENIPRDKGIIYCSKHMSNIDALILYRQSPDLIALAKAELFRVPFLNLVFRKMNVLAIKRGAGEAHKQTPNNARVVAERKTPLIIFPEGTRIKPYERRPLKSGVYYFQCEEDLDVIVVAHNSGCFWPKGSLVKQPGRIIVHYYPPIAKNLPKDEFMQEVSSILIEQSERLFEV
jgi:1-acyl-sn-glycerol-3-phosphate acyltransferase